MPIRRRRGTEKRGGPSKASESASSDAGGVSVDGSELHIGRDLIGRDNVRIGSQHNFQIGGTGLAAIVAAVGLLSVAIVVAIIWRQPSPPPSTSTAALPTPDLAATPAPTLAPTPTSGSTPVPAAVAKVEPTAAPTATPVPTAPPKPMVGRYVNVALAPIGRVDATGKVLPWPESARFMPSIRERLASELKSLVDVGEVEIRSEGVGLVEGIGEAARDQYAARLRADHHADLLIFANLQSDGGRMLLVPGFNVGTSPFDDRRGRLDGAEEIVGTSRLRLPLTDPNPVTAPEAFADRANALVYFALGLTYLQAGDSVPQPNDGASADEKLVVAEKRNKLYARAIELFDKAEAAMLDQDRGREVVHLFRGMVYQRDRGENYSPAAIAEYEKALAINPEYSRAYLGLGYGRFRQYRSQFGEYQRGRAEKPDPALLTEGEELIQSARRAKDKPAEALVDAKIQIALGTIYLVMAQDVDPSRYELSETAFSQVVRPYEAGDSALEYLASFAYFGLGAIEELRDGDLGAAAAHYRKALGATSPHPEITYPAKTAIENIEGREGKDGKPVPYVRPSRIMPLIPIGGMG